MRIVNITAEVGGFCLFDPQVMLERFPVAEDLLSRFRTTDDGDEVLRDGTLVAVQNVDDGDYRTYLRHDQEKSPMAEHCWVRTMGGANLRVASQRVVMASYDVLLHWLEDPLPPPIEVPIGIYQVLVRGFRVIGDWPTRTLEEVGFEIVLSPVERLAGTTPNLETDMRLLSWWEDEPRR